MTSLPKELGSLSEQESSLLQQLLEPVSYATGASIFKAGEEGNYALIIDSGEVRLEFDREELDSENVITVLPAGTILGELALLDQMPRSVSAYAESDVTARKITAGALEKLIASNSTLGARIYAALGKSAANKLRETNERLAESLIMSHGRMPEVDEMVEKAAAAQKRIKDWPEHQIDNLLYALCEPIITHAMELAEDAVKETHLGNAADKCTKHTNACLGIYRSLVGRPGKGIIATDHKRKVVEVADSMGVIFGMVPVTNPVSTTCFKSMIALKSRNAIILSPNRVGSKVVIKTVDMIREVLRKHGAPEDIIQVVRVRNSRQTTAAFMHHKGVSLILATGGASMVKAAYSSGTPAIGVGPGNTPCLIASDANIARAAKAIVKSKSFDNGMICGSEHNLVVVKKVRDALIDALEQEGAAVLNEEETAAFTKAAISSTTGHLGRLAIGQDAHKIAQSVSITRPYPIRLIVVPSSGITADNPYTKEKMAPVLSLFTAENDEEGIKACQQLLEIEGCGHTAVIHTESKKLAESYGKVIPASRILVNSPSMQGIIGLCTGLEPSLTLGCGTYGGNSTTDNVSYRHLLNIKRMAYFLPEKKTEEMLKCFSSASGTMLVALKWWGGMKRLFTTAD